MHRIHKETHFQNNKALKAIIYQLLFILSKNQKISCKALKTQLQLKEEEGQLV